MKKNYYLLLLQLVFIGSLLFAILVTGIDYYSYQETLAVNSNDDITHQILKGVEQVLDDITDMERGSKSYSVAQNAVFLETYNTALKDYNRHVAALSSAKVTEPVEQMQIQTFTALAEQLMRGSINRVDVANKVIGAKLPTEKDLLQSKNAMDKLHYLQGFIEAREVNKQAEYNEQKAANARRVFILTLVSSVVVVSLFIVLLIAIYKHMNMRIVAEEALVKLTNELESKVDARTQDLRKSEDNLKRAEIASKFGYWKMDMDKMTVYSSHGASVIYGLNKDVLTLTDAKGYRLPEYNDMLEEAMRSMIEEGKPYDVEYKIRRASDGVILDVHSTAEYDAATRTVFLVVKDITAEKQAQKDLNDSERNLKRGEEVAKMGYWNMNLSNGKIYSSESAAKIYGLANGNLSYEQIVQLRLPEYNELMEHAFRQLTTQKKNFDIEYKIKRPIDGKVVDIRILSEYNADSDTVFGIVQDITERKKYEKAIFDEKNLTESVFNNLPGLCYIFNEEGRFLKWNKNCETLTGYSAVEIYQMNIFDFFEESEREKVMQSTMEVLQNGFGLIEAGLATKLKGNLPYEFYGKLLAYNGQNCVLGVGFDITERKKAKEKVLFLNNQLERKVEERTAELTQANKALEAFSYSVSHDLRAPVRSIMGFSRIIQKEYGKELTTDGKELLEHIISGSKRMNAIIDDMLTLAKYDKGKVKPTRVDMKKLFRDVWDNISFNSPHHTQLLLNDLPEIQGDPSMIEQVVVNLLSNAIKYSSKKESPHVIVGYEKTDATITFSVKDNGAGFDMKNYHRLFSAFQRLHGNSEFEGTGVGLVLVKRIIEKHGGVVWADSNINEGATFYFTLPVNM